jgi:hypothetical protein
MKNYMSDFDRDSKAIENWAKSEERKADKRDNKKGK